MKILVVMPKGDVRDSFLPPKVAKLLEDMGEVDWNLTDAQLSPEELRGRLSGVTFAVTGWGSPRFSEDVLAGADSLRAIAYTAGSVAPIVSDAVYERGIRVIGGNDMFAESVAEGVIGYALASLRDIPRYARMMQEDGWSCPDWYTEGLLGQTVGLIGFGAVAKHTAKLLNAFGTTIKVHADHVTPEEELKHGVTKTTLEDIFTTCKVVSLHTSAVPEYRHIVNERLLRMLPDGALFINTSRGMCVDEAALAREAAMGRFRVVLDVYDKEPLSMDSPLRGLPNVLLMPHMAGPTVDRRSFIGKAVIEATASILAGGQSHLEITREMADRMTR